MKKISLLLLSFILFFIGYSSVAAYETGAYFDIGGGYGTPSSPCAPGSNFCWSAQPKSATSDNRRIQGFRMTVVDGNGIRLSGTKSVDFIKYDDARSKDIWDTDFKNLNYINYYKTKNTKLEVLQKGNSLNTSGNYTYGNYARIAEGDSNTVLMGNSSFAIPWFNDEGGSTNNLDKYFEEITNKNNFDTVFVDLFFQKLGYKGIYEEEVRRQARGEDIFNNRFILIEPLIYFRLSRYLPENKQWTLAYFGTVTEVANMMSGSNAREASAPIGDSYFNFFVGKTYMGISMSGNHPFMQDFPMAIFTSETRINNNIIGVGDYIHTSGKTNFADEILTINGFAVGVIWLKQFQCPVPQNITNDDLPLCCEDIVGTRYINNVDFTKCCTELVNDRTIDIRNYLPGCCHIPELRWINPYAYSTYCQEQNADLKNKCDWKLDASCPDDCEDVSIDSSTSGYIKDMDDWDCIFKSTSSSLSNIRNHYKILGNTYCEVFCREEYSYKFPSSNLVVEAGHHFTVGSNNYNNVPSWEKIEFFGYSDCRTTSNSVFKKIKHEQFVEDYAAANQRVQDTWENWQNAIALQMSINAATTGSECKCSYSCGSEEEPRTCYCSGVRKQAPTKCNGVYCQSAGSWCTAGCCGGSPNSQVGQREREYRNAVAARNELLRQIEECNNWNKDLYDFSPEIYLSYEENMYGINRLKLDKSEEEEKVFAYFNRNSGTISYGPLAGLDLKFNITNYCRNGCQTERYYCDYYSNYRYLYGYRSWYYWEWELESLERSYCNAYRNCLDICGFHESFNYYDDFIGNGSNTSLERMIMRYDCDVQGRRCTSSGQVYPANDNIRLEVKKTLDYKLPSGLYQYVVKPSGLSVREKPANLNYRYINYSNLPIHYSTPTGRYDISLHFNSFGVNNKFNKYFFNGVIFGSGLQNGISCEEDYNCTYKVSNDILKPNKPNKPNSKYEELNIVFRQISLTNPFPGKSGNGRASGSNWIGQEEIITKNRGLENPEAIFFEKEPMYKITLNPSLIRTIRQYNRTQVGGYGNFDFECLTNQAVEGSGLECRSNFIRTKFRTWFTGCGLSNDWNACLRS